MFPELGKPVRIGLPIRLWGFTYSADGKALYGGRAPWLPVQELATERRTEKGGSGIDPISLHCIHTNEAAPQTDEIYFRSRLRVISKCS